MQKSKALVALLVSCLTGLAHADTGVRVFAHFSGDVSGGSSSDEGSDPFYPSEPSYFGYGSHYVNLQWPGHTVYSYREGVYGPPPLDELGYSETLASIGVGGGNFDATLTLPKMATGSSAAFGNGWITYTLLPGATLTFSGYGGSSWNIEDKNVSLSYDLTMKTWEGALYETPESGVETLFTTTGSFSSVVADGTYKDATFSFTNNTDAAILRTFALSGNLQLNASVTPVPEPQTYTLMLAGLAAMVFVGRRRMRK